MFKQFALTERQIKNRCEPISIVQSAMFGLLISKHTEEHGRVIE
jgi:hypothetical protein